MKIRGYAIMLLIMLALGIILVMLVSPIPKYDTDITKINDIVNILATDFDQLGTQEYTLPDFGELDYVVIDVSGNLRAATRQGLSEDIYSAIRHGDTIVDITQNGQIIGKAIFWSNSESQLREYRNSVQTFMICFLCVATGICAIFLFSLHRRILRPFELMRNFAQRIASGDLDIPLEMDRGNAFGAFTESFDLMRDELRRSRENERAAEQSKRELVASLSHDIKTPVSSIKAVSELMEVTADEDQQQKLQIIQQKAGQIHALVTDLFHATLEELNSLSVNPVAFPSDLLAEHIEKADYQKKVNIGEIPGCLVQADSVRLAQVMDNIIVNSYKYANTAIDVSAEMDAQGLTLIFRDYGPGVDAEELPFLFNKYYRGKGAEGKSGYGLGLFISRSLTERMGGKLECENAEPGFAIRLWLKFDS